MYFELYPIHLFVDCVTGRMTKGSSELRRGLVSAGNTVYTTADRTLCKAILTAAIQGDKGYLKEIFFLKTEE